MTMMGADDNPTESLAAYHEARAAGGAGLIVTEAAAAHPSTAPMHIMAFRDDCIPLRRFEFPLLMLWTAPATGIAMCHIAVIVVRRESVLGYERLLSGVPSDFRCRPESRPLWGDVCFGPNFVCSNP